MDENKFYIWMVSIFGLIAITLIASIAWYYAYTTRLYIEGGYTLQTIPGQQAPQWVKQK